MARLLRILLPGMVGLFLAALYWSTLAPGITWKFDGADGGDLVTAAATGGVPHPTGYPTYLLLASVFLKIPVGSLAFRTNLLSSVCTVIAALVIFKIVREAGHGVFPASIASLAFGTFPLIWSQAIITEVNALNVLFIALVLYLFLLGDSRPLADMIRGLVAGLAAGNHLASLFTLPLMFVNRGQPGNARGDGGPPALFLASHFKSIVRRLIGFALGLGVYVFIPFRARAQAPVNWGNAVTWDRLIWLASGNMYWQRLDYFNGSYLLAGIRAWSLLLIQQLGVLGLLLVFLVLGILFKPSRLYLASGWFVLVYSVFSVLYFSPDSYVYLMPALIGLSIWMGLGSSWIAAKLPPKSTYFKPIVLLGISGFIVARAVSAIPVMNLSADHTAERYARLVLESAPPRALVVTEGDEATFALWYLHYAYRQRPDVAVVSSDLFSLPWYHDVLKSSYPDLVVPDVPQAEALSQANPLRTFCRIAPDLQPRLECSR